KSINAPHCYKCGGLGHFARDCPNLKTLAFVPNDAGPIYDTDAEPEVDELDIGIGFNLFMKRIGFEELMKSSPYVFTLVVVEENEIISEAPLQVQPLLREFADVIPNDIPHGLPAMRDIQHCIDFILGFAIPNKPAYQMNLKEFAELQRQVTELLEKGLIRETTWFYHFYKIDLRSGYHQIQMRPRDEWKITFKTRDGLYEWMVMPFAMSNAPRYIVTSSGIKMDPAKVEGDRFMWTSEAATAFDILKAKALKFIIGQHKLKTRHANWVEFNRAFSFVIQHKVRWDNQVADALSHRHSLITTVQIQVQVFQARWISGCLWHDKSFALLRELFYWPKMKRDVNKLLESCRTFHIAKTHSSNACLYTPLSVPVAPWKYVSLDFILGDYFEACCRITRSGNGYTGFVEVKGVEELGKNLLPAMLAHVGNQGNVGNQNGNVVNEKVQENVGNVIVNGNRLGCSYKEFLACNPKEYDGNGGVVVLTRWIEKMEFMHDMSGCSIDQKVKYTTGSFLEFCPSYETQKLESELWNHAMVEAGHVAYTDSFNELARLVPHLKAMQISGTLTDEAVRNGSIKKIKKIGNVGEPSKDKNGRDDNKRTRTRNAFTSTANPKRRENTATWPKCTICNSYHAPGCPCRTCFNYNFSGHLANDYKGVSRNVNPVIARNLSVWACYECGSTDHVIVIETKGTRQGVVRIPLPDSKVLRVLGERPKKKARLLKSAKASDKKQKEIVVVRYFLEEELSGQLKELQDKSFIRPSSSPWVAPFFLKINLRSGYHQLIVHEDDIPKTTFRTRYGYFKFTLMPFDDILIYSKTRDDHVKYLRLVLELLKKEKLYDKVSKCEFWLREVQFLRHGINGNRIHVDPSKIEKCKNFDWVEEKELAFQTLKDKLCNAPILALLDGPKNLVVSCDASMIGLGCVLIQRDKVIVYASRQLKIILPMIWSWRRWIELFSNYDCEIRYHHGKANVVDDSLRRKESVKPKRVRAMNMNFQLGIKDRILTAQKEAMDESVGLQKEDYKMDILARLYLNEILARHGVTISIISYCDSRFTSRFWQSMQEALGTRLDIKSVISQLGGLRLEKKSYLDKRMKPLEFSVGDYVLLKVSPWKGVIRFGNKGKLAPRFVKPFEIIEKVGPVAYRLDLPKELNDVHDTFHVSNLKKCLADPTLQVPLDEIRVYAKLNFVEEPVEILERKFKKLKRSRIAIVKVRWNSKRGPEFTWEREDQMKMKCPHLFSDVSS
nr:hypothetical protein [Tanacetum cinerariifolium]